MLILDIFAILLVIAACVFYFLIIYEILNFQIDHKNPLDIAAPLNNNVQRLKWTLVVIAILLVFDLYHNWAPILIHGFIAFYLFQKTRERNYFEPLVIVRDANTHKYTFGGFFVLTVLSFIFQLVMILILALS